MEKIIRAMECTNAQKVIFDTYLFVEEVKYWWEKSCACLESEGCVVTWESFKKGNLTMAEYVAKFEDLSRIYYEDNQARVGHYKGGVGLVKGRFRGQSFQYFGARSGVNSVTMQHLFSPDRLFSSSLFFLLGNSVT
ncbi:hypothetical protein CR513_53219, partial [Mucuna pruriens]